MTTSKNFFRASAEDFKKIPGLPVAYWAGKSLFDAFVLFEQVGRRFDVRNGITTSDNGRFLRLWHEISMVRFMVRWFPCNKGGTFRKWRGNREYLVDWVCDGRRLKTCFDDKGKLRPTLRGIEMNFRSGITMSRVTSSVPSFRLMDADSISESATNALYSKKSNVGEIEYLLAFLNSPVGRHILNLLNPTINIVPEDLRGLPVPYQKVEEVKASVEQLDSIASRDWNEFETSWDFTVNPLVAEQNNPVNPDNPVEEKGMEAVGRVERVTLPLRSVSEASDKSAFQLSSLYAAVRARWAKSCEQMRRLETEKNRIFIEAYGLQDELTPEVPWHEITLTCNPWYRYGVKEVEKVGRGGDSFPLNPELEARLKSDTVKELISYAVGCMMGRYAIDKPGLILADQGSTYGDYLAKVSEPEFDPDEDGIIPVIDEDCFADDIVIQFHKFLRTAFGAANFNANLSFIEEAIGKDLRSYFTKDFYGDHLQRYQKRPIYWLFSSPKGTFSALVYLHRYHPGTVGQVLTYLRSHITNLKSRLDAADRTTADPAATQGMKTKAIKERTKLMRQLKELEDYERDVLHPLASERLEIDLDDGVKANYPKFGKALRKIPGFE